MKYLLLLCFFLFFSCLNEELHLNYDKNVQVYIGNEKYYGNNTIYFEIKNVTNNYDNEGNYKKPDKYYTNHYAGYIKNGLLTFIYNETDNIIYDDIIKSLYLNNNIKISNREAKIKIVEDHNIIVYNEENKRIGYLNFGDYVCGGGQGIKFIYSTYNTNIKGYNHDFNYKLRLKKGWNIVYKYRRKYIQGIALCTTDNRKFSKDSIWQLILNE